VSICNFISVTFLYQCIFNDEQFLTKPVSWCYFILIHCQPCCVPCGVTSISCGLPLFCYLITLIIGISTCHTWFCV